MEVKATCEKCKKKVDQVFLRTCPLLRKSVCLNCCMRCMFQTGGKCKYGEAISGWIKIKDLFSEGGL